MKRSFLLAALCLIVNALTAQKIVEKTIHTNANKLIGIDTQISDSVNIIVWDKNEVYAKASININDNRDNEMYQVAFSETNDAVKINGKFSAGERQDSNRNIRCSVNWNIYVPKNASLKINTINGNITIVGETGSLDAKTVSGFVDIAIKSTHSADFSLKTITGTIYSDLALNHSNGKEKQMFGVKSKFNGGGKSIKLESVSGDLFVHKATD